MNMFDNKFVKGFEMKFKTIFLGVLVVFGVATMTGCKPKVDEEIASPAHVEKEKVDPRKGEFKASPKKEW